MAQRFGGKHSPTGGTQTEHGTQVVAENRRVDAAGAKANILFLPAVPLVFLSLNEGPVVLAMALVAAAMLTLAAWLLRDGLRAEAAYNARKVARRPTLPRKLAATVFTGLGVAVTALTNDTGILGAVLYGVIASALHLTAFGIDPLRNKNIDGVDLFQQDRVARVVEEAECRLASMSAAISKTSDRVLEARVEQFQNTARTMFRTVEEDPRDLTGARKYLGVYLTGARDATVKFSDLYARNKDAGARSDFEALLSDLEQNFTAQTEKMLRDDRSDMEIEIKVLRDRLQREGVKPSA
jgi:hypothetical protein